MSTGRYTGLQRGLHWGAAAIILGLLGSGLFLWQFGFQGATDILGADGRNVLYNLHKSFGLTILAVMVLRLVVRIKQGTPAYNPALEPWEALASKVVHRALYLSLIAMPLFGWLATDALNYPVEFFFMNIPQFIDKNKELGELLFQLHGITAWIIIGLLALHVGAVIMHTFIKKDGVLQRML